jgi:hypothetical protein
MTISIDAELQALVDAQLLEQGSCDPIELLIETGRLAYGDYESWRRGELVWLDSVLMGNPEKIRAQLAAIAAYARGIGLTEQTQEFHAWPVAGSSAHSQALRVSEDPELRRLIACRHVPVASAPQMDLFFDNPVVALTNGIARALAAWDTQEAQRQLDQLYRQSPNHVDLAAYDRLLKVMGHLSHDIDGAQREITLLLEITPDAKRLLSSQWRKVLAPLWRHLAAALSAQRFSSDTPDLHRSFALLQAHDWSGVAEAVCAEPEWWRQAELCLRLALSGFYRQRRSDALVAWCHLCWHASERAAPELERRGQPDTYITALWEKFVQVDEDIADAGILDSDPPLTAVDFPAWLLLHDPKLVDVLPLDLPKADSAGERAYRHIHQWTQVRRAGRAAEEMELRRLLQQTHPRLFRCLKRAI